MAEPLESLHLPPHVEVIDDEFSRLPPELANLPPEVEVINPEDFLVSPEESARLDREWDAWFDGVEPIPLPVSAADMLAEIRREEGWD